MKWPEIIFNRDSLDEKKEREKEKKGLDSIRVKGRHLTQIKKFVCNK